MLKWSQSADVIILLITKVILITSIFYNEKYLTLAQLPAALGGHPPQDYGATKSSVVGGGPGNVNTAGNGGGNGGTTGGGGSGEILSPRSFPLNGQEPTCEELRAMWRFSKRQSRAAEMTNEIPTYRDPFAYNIWEPYYATTRSVGGMRILPRYRDSTRPVYGRVVHKEPLLRLAERARTFEGMSRLYDSKNGGGGGLSSVEPRRRVQFRFSGGLGGNNAGNNGNLLGMSGNNGIIGGSISSGTGINPNSLTSHHGSFQRLKELIWTERAKELAQQRKAEEKAARAAALKEIANGFNHNSGRRPSLSSNLSPLFEENRNPDLSSSSSGTSSLSPTSDQEKHFKSIVSLPSSSSGSSRSYSPSTSALSRSGGGGSGGIYMPTVQFPGVVSEQFQQQKGSYPMKPSHFRERNRVLFRQSGTPIDYYQRDHRSLYPDLTNTVINDQLQQLSQFLEQEQQQDEQSDEEQQLQDDNIMEFQQNPSQQILDYSPASINGDKLFFDYQNLLY